MDRSNLDPYFIVRKIYYDHPIDILKLKDLSAVNHLIITNKSITHNSNQKKRLPDNLEHLPTHVVWVTIDVPLVPIVWSFHITRLVLTAKYDKPIKCFPPCLETLILDNYNHDIDNLPDTITYLELGEIFDSHIKNFPNNLHTLIFGKFFNKQLTNFPSSLYKIVFGKYYDQPIIDFPRELRDVVFGDLFNQCIDSLSDTVERLVLGDHFNYLVRKFPDNLIELIFGMNFNQTISHLYFPNLVKITFGLRFNKELYHVETSKILFVVKSKYSSIFSNTLEHIVLGEFFSGILDYLPNSVTHLTILNKNYNLKTKFPTNLQYLKISSLIKNNYDIPKNVEVDAF